MDPQLKGALVTGSVAVLGFLAKVLWNYIQSLRTKIKTLKAEEQTRWEQKVDKLELSLATVLASFTRVEVRLEEFKEIPGRVKKNEQDIQGFHIWKRLKFPEDGGPRNGDPSPITEPA